ncbi:MAG TPA: protein-disulfide reductase DsbD domain-containing protein [Croceibacterium sp.]|nr:protein-disulfide reductase DsbD domain-containing protein [Croceibacterium sp.]
MPLLKALFALLVLTLALPSSAQLAVPGTGTRHLAAELIADGPPVPGETLALAIKFTPEPGWHGYWANPGDAGYGMRLEWDLPEGWTAGEPLYPVPQKLLIAGLMNHVYEGEYAVLVPIEVPETAAVANPVPIEVKGDWLVCTNEICVPESATLTLRLGQGMGGDPRFDQWQAAVPPLLDSPARFELTADTLRLAIPLPASLELDQPHVFLRNEQLVDYGAAQTFRRDGDLLVAEIPREGLAEGAETVTGILKLDEAGNGVTFEAGPGDVPAGGTLVAGGGEATLAPLWALIGGALLGGLILNLMPCVFPILSLKALTLARAGESEAEARREGVAYTAGVVLACLALGALLLVLRALGSEIGWAFQLQEPVVVVALLLLAVAITANFAGLYELPSLSFTRAGGRASAFSTGLLAAVAATPCTGPFMAAALGAALLLPWWQGMVLFGVLGLGLALPFLLLGFVPPLRRMLPKPGAWMNTFRRLMAIPMGLTALALLWLAWRLGGNTFAVLALVLALSLTAMLILRGRALLGGMAAGLAIASMGNLSRSYQPGANEAESVLAAVPFSETALAEARASGKPVFVWFTADWCLTCKVNESVAIEREATREAFEKAGVVAMVGDWTRRDPEITRFLTAHSAAGVPLYLWYAPGGEAELLPQVLTPDSLVQLAARAS